MKQLFEAALELQQFIQSRQWPFCIIGGLAVNRWGRPRATNDVDISLLTGFGGEDQYVDGLLRCFVGRIPDARQFALDRRVLLLRTTNGVPADIALAGLPFEEEVIARSTAFTFEPGVTLVTAAADDLIVLKAFADRPQDWRDVEGIMIRQWNALDWNYITDTLTPLCELKGEPEIINRLQDMRQKTKP